MSLAKIDFLRLARCNPNLAGEIALKHMPSKILSRFRLCSHSNNPSFREVSTKESGTETAEMRLVSRISYMMKHLNQDDPIEIDPLIIQLSNGWRIAYLCDLDPDVMIVIPHATTLFPNDNDKSERIFYTILRNTDAKRPQGWEHLVIEA